MPSIPKLLTSDTPWPSADQVEQVLRLSGRTFKDLSTDEAILAVMLAYKSNAAAGQDDTPGLNSPPKQRCEFVSTKLEAYAGTAMVASS